MGGGEVVGVELCRRSWPLGSIVYLSLSPLFHTPTKFASRAIYMWGDKQHRQAIVRTLDKLPVSSCAGTMTAGRTGQGRRLSPDIAVPAEFDQLFIWGSGQLGFTAWGRGTEGRTLEFVFAYVDGCWGVSEVGVEIVDHLGD